MDAKCSNTCRLLAFIDFLDLGRAETISQEIANLTEDAGQDLETEESGEIGYIQGTVVGLRYYSGVVRSLAFNAFLCLFNNYIS